MYIGSGVLPESILELPPHGKVLVEACIQKDWRRYLLIVLHKCCGIHNGICGSQIFIDFVLLSDLKAFTCACLNYLFSFFPFSIIRRPSAKSLLESPYFPRTVKSSYLFIAPIQLLASDGSRLQYAANFAKQGALKAMGAFAAEMCAPYCLPLVVNSQSDTEAECAYVLLKEFIKCLTPKAVKTLILPAIQKILQASCEHYCCMCATFIFCLLLINKLISDYRLFTFEGITSPRFICTGDLEPHW